MQSGTEVACGPILFCELLKRILFNTSTFYYKNVCVYKTLYVSKFKDYDKVHVYWKDDSKTLGHSYERNILLRILFTKIILLRKNKLVWNSF
jgi:hypothetical protein